MKTAKLAKMMTGVLAAGLAWCAMAEGPAISDVVVRQRWPWSRLVDIDFQLNMDPAQRVDVLMTAKNGSMDLELPLDSLTGDLFSVGEGARHIVWDPTKTVYTNSQVLTQFSVTLTPTSVPLYMIVDLTKTAGAEGQIEYVYEEALTNGLWGAWVRNPVTNNGEVIESVIWTGVTTNDLYKTDKLVLRRVHEGAFKMGKEEETQLNITLTKGFYVGVFEVTQRQWEQVQTTGRTKPSGFTIDYVKRPVERVSYYEIREDSAGNSSDVTVDWPSNDTVNANSFIGLLRAKTGIVDFDLPTEAQWEYMCRAGTTTVFNDGNIASVITTTGTEDADNNGNTNKYLNVLGRYRWNGGYYWNGIEWTEATSSLGPTNGTAEVGSYEPNAWGLYDTHGNVSEWCLDNYQPSLGSGSLTNPVGPLVAADTYRMLRSGVWIGPSSTARSAYRLGFLPYYRSNQFGFRLVRRLP